MSKESHLCQRDHFPKKPIFFRIIADFDADNEIDNCNIVNTTFNIYKQNPILNGCHIVSELDDLLRSGSYESLLGYNIVD